MAGYYLMDHCEITAVVLAGGRSSRLGVDKAGLKLDNAKTLLEGVVDKVKCLSTDVVVVADAVIELDGTRRVNDVLPGGGSLCGLYSGLMAARYPRCLVVACDMPFLNLRLLRYMIERPCDYDVLVPLLGERAHSLELHPLHAIYTKHCLVAIEQVFASGSKKIRDLYPLVKTVYLNKKEVAAFDPDGLSFFNINTPQDLARARAIV